MTKGAKKRTHGKKNRLSNGITKVRQSVCALFSIAIIVACAHAVHVIIGKTFVARTVIFTGNKHLTEEELMALAGLKGGENLLTLSNSAVFERLSKSPWIVFASVRKDLPDSVHIMVREAEPFALLDMNGRLFLVDNKGNMLEELTSSSMPFLPIISGSPFGPKETFNEAINLVKAVKESELSSRKDHIEIIADKAQEMALNLDGLVVKVGKGEYEEKLMRLMEIESEIKRREIPVDYIDLRFANRVIVKPVNEVVN
jgi:cell division protein FtsQ